MTQPERSSRTAEEVARTVITEWVDKGTLRAPSVLLPIIVAALESYAREKVKEFREVCTLDAKLEERERCAKIADEVGVDSAEGREIAARIREMK